MQATETPSKAIIVHQLDAMPVGQRETDGYIHATAMCQAAGKLWGDYRRSQVTEDFFRELRRSMGIPIDLLTLTVNKGKNEHRGTWVHPFIAVNLAQWCSAKFAVQVSKWMVEWAQPGEAPLQKMPMTMLYNTPAIQKARSPTMRTWPA